jgi:hypothetical protein
MMNLMTRLVTKLIALALAFALGLLANAAAYYLLEEQGLGERSRPGVYMTWEELRVLEAEQEAGREFTPWAGPFSERELEAYRGMAEAHGRRELAPARPRLR